MDTKRMRACAPMLEQPAPDIVIECLDEIDRLRAEVAALRQDADRYRWWRALWCSDPVANPLPQFLFDDQGEEELDAAIDNARKA